MLWLRIFWTSVATPFEDGPSAHSYQFYLELAMICPYLCSEAHGPLHSQCTECHPVKEIGNDQTHLAGNSQINPGHLHSTSEIS